MLGRRKLELLLLLAIALAGAVLLASGLSSLALEPGQLRTPGRPLIELEGGALSGAFRISPDVLRIVRIAFLIMLPIALVYVLTNPEARRRVVTNALLMGAAGYALYLWFRRRGLARLGESLDLPDLTLPQPGQSPDALDPGAFIQQPPAWLAFTLTAALIALTLLGGWLLWRAMRPRPDEARLLALQAQRAADDLQAGASFRDVIIRCYHDMSRILSDERGIRREAAMTPREFERRLLAAGLPAAHVERLTGLFEAVRYGAHTAAPGEEQAAIRALRGIAEAVQSADQPSEAPGS